MVRGGEFSDALLSLEDNLDQVRRDLRVLELGLATGGPRPYQDSRSHHWCMLRLRRVLGFGSSGVGGGQRGEGEGKEEAAVKAELASLTNELLGEAAAAATMPHLFGVGKPGEEQGTEAGGVDAGTSSSASPARTDPAAGMKSYWPRLTELRISCGIMSGDMEGLARCLGR